jgi:transposase
VVNGSGVTRGDKRRNARRESLRELVPVTAAVVGIDLGEDKQVLVVTDHDSRVLYRKTLRVKASGLGPGLDAAAKAAAAAGFTSVTVGCEPTGARWMQVQDLARERAMVFVCVQPLATHRAREEEDYTFNKSDDKDSVLIARLVTQLRCYVPETCEGDWADLRQGGARRAELITRSSVASLQMQALLALAWPAALKAAAQPLASTTWLAAMAVVLDRCDGDLARVRRMGTAKFTNAVKRELPRWGGRRVCGRIVAAVFAALGDTSGSVQRQAKANLQRTHWAMEDLRTARAQQRQVEDGMLASLRQLGLTEVLATIPGLSLEGAAQILAEAGDPHRFTSSRSLVKHAGLNPAENTSATFKGRTRVSKRGRPGLRLAAWRGVWGVIRHNPVMAARFAHLTTREDNRLTRGQAQVACAATLLRWIHAIITTQTTWDPAIASGDRDHTSPQTARTPKDSSTPHPGQTAA